MTLSRIPYFSAHHHNNALQKGCLCCCLLLAFSLQTLLMQIHVPPLSTDTFLAKITNDIYITTPNGQLHFLIILATVDLGGFMSHTVTLGLPRWH